MSIEKQAEQFANNPGQFFASSVNNMGSIPRAEMIELQKTALQMRFAELRDRIPMLKKLADEQGIEEINDFNDVVPLLFEHTMYKSYPSSLLEKGRFSQINKWLNKLTAHDISTVDVSHCKSIDSWLEVMQTTPLRISHSSGTSGTMSFVPHDADDFEAMGEAISMSTIQKFGEESSDKPVHVILPFFRSGCSALMRANDMLVKHIAKGEDNFHAAYPQHMSSDVLYLAARIRAAQAKGTLDRLEISDELMQRKKEFEAIEADMPAHLDKFYNELFEQLQGQRIYAIGTWNVMHKMATAGLERGQEAVFASDSAMLCGGGKKEGMMPPENWEDDVCRYIGISRLTMVYGMSEIFGTHAMCSHGRYHLVPWVIPFLLDPETSKPLPREGVVTGRAAFFGLIARSAWGGFITGDEITIDWSSQCGCGQTTYHLDPKIQRFTDKTGEDDKISCAATPNAHREAMSFLSSFEQ